MDLELCIESLESALLAQKYGFKRVELCSALDLGGLTPSPALISEVSSLDGIETHVMIRPRAGNFNYSAQALRIMEKDIRQVKKLGADGVVFGILDPRNDLNAEATRNLTKLTHSLGLQVTFHRAFDLVNDPHHTLKELIRMNVDRVLTSGLALTAMEGINLIRELVQTADRRIQIMAGSGIDHTNVLEFKKVRVDAVHFSARKAANESEQSGMGRSMEPDHIKIEKILNILNAG